MTGNMGGTIVLKICTLSFVANLAKPKQFIAITFVHALKREQKRTLFDVKLFCKKNL